MSSKKKPTVRLIGNNGNAFAIISACCRTAKKAGWETKRIDAFCSEATSGDYDHLLQTAMRHFEVE